jgi:flagellar hook-basal body complex protein FliE
MSIGALDAGMAYGRAISGSKGGSLLPSAPLTESGGSEGAGLNFGAMVGQMVGSATNSLHGAEKASAAQVAGKGNLIDVVTAIGAAETALDTVVAVRDRVVSAYGEIMRMQI